MPTKKLISRSTRILKKLLIEMFAGDMLSILVEDDDFVIILKQLLASKIPNRHYIHTSGFIDKPYVSKSWCRSDLSNKPF